MKNTMQQHVAEVKYTGYASGNELVWTRGAGLQFLPDGTKLYAASIHAPTPAAYLDVGAGGYMYLGTDLTEDQVGSLPWGRHILAIVGTYGADGYVPAERPFDYTEAYQGARQDLAIWKRRALEAELRVLEQKPDQSICDFYEATDYPSLVRELVGHVKQLQEAAMRNVKPWEDTFPPTLLPSYIERIESADAEQQPAPDVATQILNLIFDECRYWHGRDEALRGGYAILYAKAKELINKQKPAPALSKFLEKEEWNDAFAQGFNAGFNSDEKPAPDVEGLVGALEQVLYCNEVGFLPIIIKQSVSSALAAYRKGGVA